MRRLGPAVLCVLALLAACGDDGDESSATTTSAPTATSATSTTSTADPAPQFTSEEQEVIDAYLEFWDVRIDVLDPPDPTDPRIPEILTGSGLETFVTQVEQRQADGIGVRSASPSRYGHIIERVELEGDATTIESCELDDRVVYDVATGAVINDEVGSFRLRVDLRLDEGRWKVLSIEILEELSDPEACAA